MVVNLPAEAVPQALLFASPEPYPLTRLPDLSPQPHVFFCPRPVGGVASPSFCGLLVLGIFQLHDLDWTDLMSNRTMYFHVLLEAE